MKFRKFLSLLIVFTVVMTMVMSGIPTVSAWEGSITSVTLNKHQLTLILNSEKLKIEHLTFTFESNDALPYHEIYWNSYDTNIVTVDQNGHVTAVGIGTADISLTNAYCEDVCHVTVIDMNEYTYGGYHGSAVSCRYEFPQ